MRKTTKTIIIGATCAAMTITTTAGCEIGEANIVAGVVEDYLHDLSAGNWRDACSRLSDDVIGDGCEDTLSEAFFAIDDDFAEAVVTYVAVDGSTARVDDGSIAEMETRSTGTGKNKHKVTYYQTLPDITYGDGFALERINDEWIITAI